MRDARATGPRNEIDITVAEAVKAGKPLTGTVVVALSAAAARY
jgi:hypothetical protein